MAVIEITQTTYQESLEVDPSAFIAPEITRPPEVYVAYDAEYEMFTQARFKRWLGSIASQCVIESVDETEKDIDDTDLLDSMRQANKGSVEDLKRVGKNVDTAVSEVCFKEDHVSIVSTHLNEAGERIQFGQTTRSIDRNAIIMRPNRHSKLQEITHIEALNNHRIEDAIRADKLKEHYFVVASIVPNGVPEDDLGHGGDGYFLDSLTFAIQATTEQSDSEITTQTGFMAGVEAKDGDSFEDRRARRYDIRALAKVYERLGKKPPNTAAEFLDKGLYIPKDLMPNGVVDFMRWCAEAADEILGRVEERRPEDYVALIEKSKNREASLESTRQKVLNELLSAADSLSKPMDAVRLMWQLVKKHTVEASFKNKNINPRVFGRKAAPYIMQIRQHIENGNPYITQALMQRAHATAVITACGGGDGKKDDGKTEKSIWETSLPGEVDINSPETVGENKCLEVKDGQIVKCPDCKETVKAIVPNKDKIYCSNPVCKSAHPSVKRVN